MTPRQMAAVSVAYECRKNKVIRRIDEIAVAFRLSVSVFWKAYFRFETYIKEQAAKRQLQKPQVAAAAVVFRSKTQDHTLRLCNQLGFSMKSSLVAEQIAPHVEEQLEGRPPTTLAATVVYIVSILSVEKSDNVSLASICKLIDISPGTVKKAFALVKPFIDSYLPSNWVHRDIQCLPKA